MDQTAVAFLARHLSLVGALMRTPAHVIETDTEQANLLQLAHNQSIGGHHAVVVEE
jgi:hypothetical protein